MLRVADGNSPCSAGAVRGIGPLLTPDVPTCAVGDDTLSVRHGGRPAARKAAALPVYVVSPGGRSAAGGICRIVDYFMTEWEMRGRQPPLVLVDSYGPDVKWLMPFHFAVACGRIIADGMRGRIGLLHLHVAERGSVLRKGTLIGLARRLGIGVVLHVHGAEFVEFHAGLPAVLKWAMRASFRRADRTVVLGEGWRHFFVNTVGLDRSRVRIVRNAVPRPAVTLQRPTTASQTCRLVFAGTLSDRKGLMDLLMALGDERLRGADWRLDVAGNGNQAAFQAQADASCIADKVVFHGWMDSAGVHHLLAAADAMVLPSRSEGLPMILIEGMAHGLAVVSTPVGAIGEIVEAGVNGLLVPPKDVTALARAVAALIADPDLRRRMGNAGRARFERELEITGMNDRLEAIFAEVGIAYDRRRTPTGMGSR